MTTSTKSKDAPEVQEDLDAVEAAPAELSEAQKAEVTRQYVKLRSAATPGDAEEARDKIRALLGADAEIGDHVLVLADGRRVRSEYAGSTMHDGVPVISAYTSIQ